MLYEVKERIKAFLIGLILMPVGAFITRLTENMYVDVFGLIVILFGVYLVLWSLGLEKRI